MRTVLTRCLLGVLDDRKISVFQVAEAVSLPVTDLKRLVEFASPLDPEASGRPVAWGMRMVVVSRPKSRAPVSLANVRASP